MAQIHWHFQPCARVSRRVDLSEYRTVPVLCLRQTLLRKANHQAHRIRKVCTYGTVPGEMFSYKMGIILQVSLNRLCENFTPNTYARVPVLGLQAVVHEVVHMMNTGTQVQRRTFIRGKRSLGAQIIRLNCHPPLLRQTPIAPPSAFFFCFC